MFYKKRIEELERENKRIGRDFRWMEERINRLICELQLRGAIGVDLCPNVYLPPRYSMNTFSALMDHLDLEVVEEKAKTSLRKKGK